MGVIGTADNEDKRESRLKKTVRKERRALINIIRAMERSRLDIHACARLLYTRTEARGATGTLSMAPNEPIGSISRARYDTSNQSRCYEFHRIFRPCRNFVPIPMKPSISFHNFHFCTKPKFHRACPSFHVPTRR